jgi:hypothetical protein
MSHVLVMMNFISVCPYPTSCRHETAYFHGVVHRKRDRDPFQADRAASVQLQQAHVGDGGTVASPIRSSGKCRICHAAKPPNSSLTR